MSSGQLADKMMDDIRKNENISGMTLNELRWQRYGVTMATSTLYKMRSVTLAEIIGGHDESYGFLPKYCEMIKEMKDLLQIVLGHP